VKKILLAVAAIPVFFWSIWMVFPASSIQSIIEDSVRGTNLTMEVQGLKKGFFYALSVDKVTLKSSGEDLVSFNNIRSRINLIGLIRMQLDISMDGEAGSGKIAGNAILKKSGLQTTFDYKAVAVGEMPFLKRGGIQGTGTLSGRFFGAGDKGHIEFVARSAHFEPVVLSGIRVPMNFFNDVTGSIVIGENVIEVVSVYLEGKDIHARLKGVIKNSVMDLNMELMPGRSFLENPLFNMEMDRYRVSPGYYVIPVRGNLSL
jgi:type II secretion system protein N